MNSINYEVTPELMILGSVIAAVVIGIILWARSILHKLNDQTAELEDDYQVPIEEDKEALEHVTEQRVYWDLNGLDDKLLRRLIARYMEENRYSHDSFGLKANVSPTYISKIVSPPDDDQLTSRGIGYFNRVLNVIGLKIVIVRKGTTKFIPVKK